MIGANGMSRPGSPGAEPRGEGTAAAGEPPAAVSPVHSEVHDWHNASETARRGRVFLAIGAAVFAVGASAWIGWRWSRPHPVRDHWDAVARGRTYLQYGRPDLAIQAVFDVRDEAPGAGAAMTVAGLALIRLGEYG